MAAPLKATKVVDIIVVNHGRRRRGKPVTSTRCHEGRRQLRLGRDVLVGSLISILEPVMVVVLGSDRRLHRHRPVRPMISLIQAVSGPQRSKPFH